MKAYRDCNMVRLHPKTGGVRLTFNNQNFKGVSFDVFSQLDSYDAASIYRVSRKANMTIKINPKELKPDAFFKKLVGVSKEGRLQGRDQKSSYNGDTVEPTKYLQDLLPNFQLDDTNYVFDSVGIAAGKGYASYNHRRSSHMEIKFLRQGANLPMGGEHLVLNLHLSACDTSRGDPFQRLENCIGLFYHLACTDKSKESGALMTTLQKITLDNFKDKKYGISIPSDIAGGEGGYHYYSTASSGSEEANAYQTSYTKYLYAKSRKPKSRSTLYDAAGLEQKLLDSDPGYRMKKEKEAATAAVTAAAVTAATAGRTAAAPSRAAAARPRRLKTVEESLMSIGKKK